MVFNDDSQYYAGIDYGLKEAVFLSDRLLAQGYNHAEVLESVRLYSDKKKFTHTHEWENYKYTEYTFCKLCHLDKSKL